MSLLLKSWMGGPAGGGWASYWAKHIPTNFFIENLSDTEVNIGWNNNINLPDGVRIYISTDNIVFTNKGEVTSGYENFVADGLIYGTTYYFYIVGYKGCVESDPSLILNIRCQTRGEYVIRKSGTLAWFDLDLTTITKDGADKVSLWSDKLTGIPKLTQTTPDNQPIYSVDGILFDGINDILAMSLNINQPATIYLVFKQVSWTLNDSIYDGADSTHRLRVYQNDSSPRLLMYAGLSNNYNDDLNVGNFGIFKFVFDGANSYSRVFRLPIVGKANVGAYNTYAFKLGGAYNGGACSNIQVKELLIRSGVDNTFDDDFIYNCLQNKHGYASSLFDNGKLVITTDDFSENIYDVFHPLIMTQGITCTHYVYGQRIDSGSRWDQVIDVYNDGMDIQCHTYNHTRLSDLTEAQIITELNTNKAAFVSNGLPEPDHIAYPFGSVNADVINAMINNGLRVSGRTVSNGFIYKDTNKYLLSAKAIDGIDAAGIITLKANLDEVQANKYGYIIYLHGVDDAGSCTSAQLNDIINYAKGIGMDIINISQLIALMNA